MRTARLAGLRRRSRFNTREGEKDDERDWGGNEGGESSGAHSILVRLTGREIFKPFDAFPVNICRDSFLARRVLGHMARAGEHFLH